MKKAFTALAAAALLALTLTGCNQEVTGTSSTPDSGNSSGASDAGSQTGELSGKLVFAGSSSMEGVMSKLTEEFGKAHEKVTFEVGVTGSGAAITGLNNGTAQIGNLSRDVKEEENPDGKFEVITIALDGIAVIVNPNNPVSDLTKEQIADIFTGKITNWKDLGGADKTIYVVGRDATSGTRDGFESILGVKEKCAYEAELPETGDVKAKISSDEAAIGYISFASVSDGVKALQVGGVTVSTDTIADNSYVIQRPFVHAYVKGTKDDLVLAYLDFLKTDKAQELIESEHLVPVEFWK